MKSTALARAVKRVTASASSSSKTGIADYQGRKQLAIDLILKARPFPTLPAKRPDRLT